MQIPESDMIFGDFSADDCFWIEKSRLYSISLRHLGFKSVEFVLYRSGITPSDGELLFVEAKTSLRHNYNGLSFAAEISDISQKYMDALQIVCAIWHGGRKESEKLPRNFIKFYESGKKIVFILVVKNGDRENLPTVGDAIRKRLLKENRLWKFEVLAINESDARKKNLIVTEDCE